MLQQPACGVALFMVDLPAENMTRVHGDSCHRYAYLRLFKRAHSQLPCSGCNALTLLIKALSSGAATIRQLCIRQVSLQRPERAAVS